MRNRGSHASLAMTTSVGVVYATTPVIPGKLNRLNKWIRFTFTQHQRRQRLITRQHTDLDILSFMINNQEKFLMY